MQVFKEISSYLYKEKETRGLGHRLKGSALRGQPTACASHGSELLRGFTFLKISRMALGPQKCFIINEKQPARAHFVSMI